MADGEEQAEVHKAEVDKASWTAAAVSATLLPWRDGHAVVQADSLGSAGCGDAGWSL